MGEKCKVCKRNSMFKIFESDVPICVCCMRDAMVKAFYEFKRRKENND